jgi:hypothetical protein
LRFEVPGSSTVRQFYHGKVENDKPNHELLFQRPTFGAYPSASEKPQPVKNSQRLREGLEDDGLSLASRLA